jgi:hypothetical protein
MRKMIKKGDIVHVRQEWQEPGDNQWTWIALDDEIEGADTIKIATMTDVQSFVVPAGQAIKLWMLHEGGQRDSFWRGRRASV